jgi:hypothetical protein
MPLKNSNKDTKVESSFALIDKEQLKMQNINRKNTLSLNMRVHPKTAIRR